jgi:hypothetical protein
MSSPPIGSVSNRAASATRNVPGCGGETNESESARLRSSPGFSVGISTGDTRSEISETGDPDWVVTDPACSWIGPTARSGPVAAASEEGQESNGRKVGDTGYVSQFGFLHNAVGTPAPEGRRGWHRGPKVD